MRQFLAAAAIAALGGAVDPTATLSLSSGASMHAAPAAFGASIPSEGDAWKLTLRFPGDLLDGCDPAAALWPAASTKKDGVAVLAARSPNCTFSQRAAAAAKAGAKVLIVYNTVEGIYRNRSKADKKYDYDCDRGRGSVAKPFTKADKLDGFRASSCASACKSGRCLLTGDDYEDGAEVCCAWDTYMTMAGDDKGSALDADKIAAVFVTMRDADKLRKDPDLTLPAPNAATAALWDDSDDSIFSWSSIAIWALGVATCAYAAWASGDEIRKRTRRAANGGAATHAAVGASDEDPMDFELTPLHAVGFICIASGSLLVLFYLDLYLFVTVAFAASSASSTATVCWRPMIEKLAPGLARRDLFRSPKYGAMSMLDAASASIGIAVASWWLACRDASYAWALQDLFGVCLCVLFLGLIKLNNLRVASMLLGMAFCYDIFFVFISPYFFEESVMVKVATGKGPTKDADFCEKYPDDDGCKSTSLPMLLLLPRGAAAGGGYTMLGLGDIVLPGLLVSFAARYDATLAAARGSAWANSAWPKHFLVVLFGYGVGLAMANVAVAVFEMGQPALLYLVPCTLGLFVAVAKRDGTFNELWHGPQALEGGGGGAPVPAAAAPAAYSGGSYQAEDEALLTKGVF